MIHPGSFTMALHETKGVTDKIRGEIEKLPEKSGVAGEIESLPEKSGVAGEIESLPERVVIPEATTVDNQTDAIQTLEGAIEKAAESSAGQAGSGADTTAKDNEIRQSPAELTDVERAKIKEETGWSDKIVSGIRSMEEYDKVYKNAGLHEETIDGRPCLVKNIDMDYIDPKTGMTNRERMEKGRAPIDAKTGEKIELHHMGQDFDSPLAELCENSEHGDGNDAVLHDKKAESWRQDPALDNQYNNVQRPNHWKERAKED